ncbi:MAG: glucose-6-phosphate isomerase [Acholeplasmataceae bacterium]|jgi:glucose-6-phosphate isomerase|nr:glucose-6-phosphate isomerase [Acholeplasmataceae bacterium]
MLKVNDKYVTSFLKKRYATDQEILNIHEMIHQKTGLGREYLGWVDQPLDFDQAEVEAIKQTVKKLKTDSEVLLVIGIGGSYLGAKAAIEMSKEPFQENSLEVIFAGYQLSAAYTKSLLEYLKVKDFSINVISKSGTTLESAIAFRIFKQLLEQKYGKEEANKRIYVTTDKNHGVLINLAKEKEYQTFVVPEDIGGRYSVLSAVGLLPICAAGISIDEILKGARKAYDDFLNVDNEAYKYARLRYDLYRSGKLIDLFVSYEPNLVYLAEWWKQLFGESEGKDGKGLFVSSASFSTDLHSLGQMIQEGPKILFETVLKVIKAKNDLVVPRDEQDLDELNYLANKSLQEVNEKAFLGTLLAHTDGGVPNIIIEIEKLDAYHFGYLVYFFFKACAMSAYLLKVNPFNQPGVESYKENMFALLGKPGFEELAKKLTEKLKKGE